MIVITVLAYSVQFYFWKICSPLENRLKFQGQKINRILSQLFKINGIIF